MMKRAVNKHRLANCGQAILLVLLLAGAAQGCRRPDLDSNCPEAEQAKIRQALQQLCSDMRGEKGRVFSVRSRSRFNAFCEGEVRLNVLCEECDAESPSPCAFIQPDLPLEGDWEAILEQYRAIGGVLLLVCIREDGTLPAVRDVEYQCGSLRWILLHELMHVALNDPSHTSSVFGEVEQFYPEEQATAGGF